MCSLRKRDGAGKQGMAPEEKGMARRHDKTGLGKPYNRYRVLITVFFWGGGGFRKHFLWNDTL